MPPIDADHNADSNANTPVSDRAETSPSPLSIDEQIAALEVECKFRTTKVRQAGRMKDVAQMAALDIRGEVLSRQSEIRGLKQLQLACESRMRELIGAHMLELRNIRDVQLFIQMRSHYQHREWGYLKGPYPMLFREADGEAERIERRLEREQDLQNRRRRGR
jgi:hypothetical protein